MERVAEGLRKRKVSSSKKEGKDSCMGCKEKSTRKQFGVLKSNDQRNQIFKEARRMKNENQDIVGEKCIKDNDGNLAFDDKSKINCLEMSLRKAS